MKNIIYLSAIIIGMVFMVQSCDKIEYPYTTIGNNTVGTNDTIRKVLLEDFTGHTCVNCPTAHKIANDLHKVYGKKLIIVAIHGGYFSQPKSAPFDYDFRTSEGNELTNFFGVSTTPIGMVNRIKQNNGSYLVDKGAFGSETSKQLDSLPEKPELYIHLSANFNNADSTLSVETNTTFLESMPAGKYNLCIMITEDEIIKAQKNNDPSVGITPEILDYEHNHVLRGMLTPTFGDTLFYGAPTINQTINRKYISYKLGSDWNPAKCNLVAFVIYADGIKNNQIIQAQEIKIK